MNVEIHPLAADRWDDLVTLFGPIGAHSNCWCTWWILGKEYGEAEPKDRRALLEKLTKDEQEPGLLAYRSNAPVGWCAVGPRQRYARMMSERSQNYRPVDETAGNWVINCFFLQKAERRRGIATMLLEAAVDFAFAHGAGSIDAYPLINTTQGADSLFVGTVSMFERAGFVEIRRMRQRPLMRRTW